MTLQFYVINEDAVTAVAKNSMAPWAGAKEKGRPGRPWQGHWAAPTSGVSSPIISTTKKCLPYTSGKNFHIF